MIRRAASNLVYVQVGPLKMSLWSTPGEPKKITTERMVWYTEGKYGLGITVDRWGDIVTVQLWLLFWRVTIARYFMRGLAERARQNK